MDYLDFSEEEIQEQLEILGYKNIPKHRLREFKKELDELIRCGEWKAFTSVAQKDSTKPQPISQPSPPAFTKEKVTQCYIGNSGKGFFLHSSKADEEKQVLNTWQNRDNGRQQEYTDSYAQLSVAPKLQLPAGAPLRLQVEPEPEDTLQPPHTDSYTSSPDYQGRCLIKRKVLRKHKGQSLVCDESFYSEYSEKHEEEEIIERMVIEDEAKFVAEAEASLLKEPKLKDQGIFTEEGSKDGINVVEEEEKTERVVNEEDSVSVAEDEDSLQKDLEEEQEINGEEEIEQVVNDEDSNLVSEEEHSLQEDPGKEDGSEGKRPELEGKGNSSSESYSHQSVNEEAEKMEHVVDETDDYLQEDSEDEKPEVNNKEDLTSRSSEEGSDDDYDGDDDDEEEENERVFSEEDLFQPAVEADDPRIVASEGKNRHNNNKEVEIELKVKEEDFKLLYKTDSLQKDSAKEKPEENNQNFPTWSWKHDDDDEKNCTISCSSTAPSLITSGYGTYRPEEQEDGDHKDDHTITEFDQDSRGVLSAMRDNEEDVGSFSSYGGFDVENDFRENQNENRLDFPVACCEHGGRREEVDPDDLKPNDNKEPTGEEKCQDLHTESENKEGQQRQPYAAIYEDTLLTLEKHLEAIQSDPEEGGGYEKLHEEEQNHMKKKAKSRVELGDSDESLNNKDIKFIDSKVDFNWAMYKKMLEEWEGNLRQKTDTVSCLEERLAEVDLSASPQHEDVVSQSDTLSSEADGISLSAFESYIRGMTQSEGDGDFRPKPKSFIRPVMSQQSVKKTDPVSKYFQYKQFWEMYKLPGERDRKDLRWEIKERLAYQPPPPKPRRVLVPNTYVVPTEKKRSALRWEVRNDLANGVLPHKFNYQL